MYIKSKCHKASQPQQLQFLHGSLEFTCLLPDKVNKQHMFHSFCSNLKSIPFNSQFFLILPSFKTSHFSSSQSLLFFLSQISIFYFILSHYLFSFSPIFHFLKVVLHSCCRFQDIAGKIEMVLDNPTDPPVTGTNGTFFFL